MMGFILNGVYMEIIIVKSFLVGATFGVMITFVISGFIFKNKPSKREILKNAPSGATEYIIDSQGRVGYYVNGELTYNGHSFGGYRDEDKKPMPKIYFNCVEHVVEADDLEHEKEIGSEISDEMDVNHNTFFRTECTVKQVNDSENATHEPTEGSLKMTVHETLEEKFRQELIDLLNNFQEKNDCKIDYWSWVYSGENDYVLRLKMDRNDQNLIN